MLKSFNAGKRTIEDSIRSSVGENQVEIIWIHGEINPGMAIIEIEAKLANESATASFSREQVVDSAEHATPEVSGTIRQISAKLAGVKK